MYHRQITHTLALLPRCQLHIMLSERLRNKTTREDEMNRLASFLGLAARRQWSLATWNVRSRPYDFNSSEGLEANRVLRNFYQSENEKLIQLFGQPIAEWMG